jgi:hypothetical protein
MSAYGFFFACLTIILSLSSCTSTSPIIKKYGQQEVIKQGNTRVHMPATCSERTGRIIASPVTAITTKAEPKKKSKPERGYLTEKETAALEPLKMINKITEEVQKRVMKIEKNGITSYMLKDDYGFAGSWQVYSSVLDSVKGFVIFWSHETVAHRILVHRQYLVSIETGKILDYMELKLTREGYSPDEAEYNRKLFKRFKLSKIKEGVNCQQGTSCLSRGMGFCSVDTIDYKSIDKKHEYTIFANFPESYVGLFKKDPAYYFSKNYEDYFWRTLGAFNRWLVLPDERKVFLNLGPQVTIYPSDLVIKNQRIGYLYFIEKSIFKEAYEELYRKNCTPITNHEDQNIWGKCKVFLYDDTCHFFWQAVAHLAIFKALESEK